MFRQHLSESLTAVAFLVTTAATMISAGPVPAANGHSTLDGASRGAIEIVISVPGLRAGGEIEPYGAR